MQRRSWHSLLWILLIALLLQIPAVSSRASHKKVQLEGVRYWVNKDYIRVAIDLSGPARYSYHVLHKPERLYIDIYKARVNKSIKPIIIKEGFVKRVRPGQYNKDTVRVVMDIQGKVNHKIFSLPSPDRIVIDLYRKVSPPVKKPLIPIKKIVIDPGHGGKDSGAIGKYGLMEKDIVLDVGLRLKKLIEKRLPIKVIMTRDRDVFIPLEERTAIANASGAGLFISIHTNANPSRKIRGVETYLLGRASDRRALLTASLENKVSAKSMDTIQLILADLLTTAKKDESLRLAHYVQSRIVKKIKGKYGVPDLGVKRAPFYVLVNARMPSILAEISFISNPREERLLATKRYKQDIAEAIFRGVKAYIDSLPVFTYPREAVSVWNTK